MHVYCYSQYTFYKSSGIWYTGEIETCPSLRTAEQPAYNTIYRIFSIQVFDREEL